jgi:Reverse transcriptase (RNA-dependent DNA polymerase).
MGKTSLSNLRFADDIVLFSPDPKIPQAMLLELYNHSKSAGLSINHNKTKMISNRQQERIMLKRTEIQYNRIYVLRTTSLIRTWNGKRNKKKSHTSIASIVVNEVHPPRQINQL